MADIKKKLKKLQGDWEEAEAAEGGRKRFKDGDYTGKLKSMEIGESKGSGRTQLVTAFEVVEPEKYEGEEIRMFNGIDDKGMPYLKLLCNQFGIEMPDDLVDLPDVVSEFADDFDGTVEIALVTKDGYQNVYVNEVSGVDSDDDDDDDDDDDKKKKGKKDKKKDKKKKKGDDDDDDDDDDDNNDDDDDDADDDDGDGEPKLKKGAKKDKKDKKKKKKK
jgi:hypothetical protein